MRYLIRIGTSFTQIKKKKKLVYKCVQDIMHLCGFNCERPIKLLYTNYYTLEMCDKKSKLNTSLPFK